MAEAADKILWEYTVITYAWQEGNIDIDEWEDQINDLGNQGWELVTVIFRPGVAVSTEFVMLAHFKRQL